MKSEVDFFKIETNHILPRKGRVLIAEPFLHDFYFKSALVLITEHNDKGTIGLVLNKPVNLKAEEVLKDFPFPGFPLTLGGPVSTDSIHYIHTLGNQIHGSIQVKENIYWGGDFAQIKELISNGTASPNDIRFFLGYSGWQPEQLEEELKENSWLVSSIHTHAIMHTSMDSIWKDTLRQMGQKYKMWINSPSDPFLN